MSNSVYTSKIVSSEALTKSTALQLHDKATKNFPSCKRFMYNYHTVKQKVLRKAIEIHRNMHLLLIAMAIKMIAFPQIIIEALMKSWNSKRDIHKQEQQKKKLRLSFRNTKLAFFFLNKPSIYSSSLWWPCAFKAYFQKRSMLMKFPISRPF